MEKALRINAFRNIGFKDGKPHDERLVLSHSNNLGEIGDLVIVIGENNSGKSNVLDALDTMGNGHLKKEDATDLIRYMDDDKPKLFLSYRDDNGEEWSLSKEEIDSETTYIYYPKRVEQKSIFETTTETFKDQVDKLIDIEQRIWGTQKFKEVEKFYPLDTKQKLEDALNFVSNTIKKITASATVFKKEFKAQKNNYYSRLNQTLASYDIDSNTILKDIENAQKIEKNFDYYSSIFEKEHNYPIRSKVFRYHEKEIKDSDLLTDDDNIDESDFFKKSFKAIKYDIQKIKKIYEKYRDKSSPSFLKAEAKNINQKMKVISDNFNAMYNTQENPYKFEINLESEEISLSIYRGEQPLPLKNQSTGFKWFFNLYFNLFNTEEFHPGDIIIMDEPATNLHVRGQQELRKFLKDFAIRNDIIIVIATHSPFLIDADYLDELRVLKINDGVTTIENQFAAIDPGNPDTTADILDALTIKNHVLLAPDNTVIFVEGITDYNYLTAMKSVLDFEGVCFLPINGVKTTKKDQEKLAKELMRLKRKDAILLVDNDNAGKGMSDVCKDSDMKVASIGDINPELKTIESLFSNEDSDKFKISTDNKHASNSSLFKKKVLKDPSSISDETKENFKALFDKIKNEIA